MIIEHVSWDDIYKFVDQIVEYYEQRDKTPSGVYGVPRGGLVLAVMLSHKLAIPLLMAPYDDCLIVDDITDSGESLIHFSTMKYDIMTIVKGPNSTVEPKLFYKERQADWVSFPWEGGAFQTNQDARKYYNARGEVLR